MYTRRLSLASLALVVFCLSGAPAVKADEIALWNFNDSNLIVDRGFGTLTTTANPTNVTFFGGTTLNARMGDPAGMALAIQGGANLQNNGSILEVRASTLGFTNIFVSFAFQRSDTGFDRFQFQISTDGTTFTNAGNFTLLANSFFEFTGNFGPEVSNNPNFAFRVVLNGATNENGNILFDNIVVEGTRSGPAVPEPATLLLLGTGLVGITAKVRRRRLSR